MDERKQRDENWAEQRKRWREGETLLEGDGDDVGLPASEVDSAKILPDKGDGRPGGGGPGTIPPPD